MRFNPGSPNLFELNNYTNYCLDKYAVFAILRTLRKKLFYAYVCCLMGHQ